MSIWTEPIDVFVDRLIESKLFDGLSSRKPAGIFCECGLEKFFRFNSSATYCARCELRDSRMEKRECLVCGAVTYAESQLCRKDAAARRREEERRGERMPYPRAVATLNFAADFIEQNGHAPTSREIADALQLTGTKIATEHLRALRKLGFVDWDGDDRSTLRILKRVE